MQVRALPGPPTPHVRRAPPALPADWGRPGGMRAGPGRGGVGVVVLSLSLPLSRPAGAAGCAPVSEAGGHRFESCAGHHQLLGLGRVCRVQLRGRSFAVVTGCGALRRPFRDRHGPRTCPPGSARIEHRPAKPEIDRSNRSAGTRSRPHGPVEWSPLCRSGDRGFESPWGRHSLRRGAIGSAAGCYPEGCRFESCRRSQHLGHR